MACAAVKPVSNLLLLHSCNHHHHHLHLPVIVGGGLYSNPSPNFGLKRSTKNALPPPPILPMIRAAQTSPDHHSYYVPDVKFYKVEAILRPWRIPQVSSALLKMGIRGVTVSDVRGFGAQGGLTERQAGSEFSEDKFLAKVKMEIVVSKDQVESVIDKIIEEARTGEIGDGKIFVLPVAEVIRVRTDLKMVMLLVQRNGAEAFADEGVEEMVAAKVQVKTTLFSLSQNREND